MSTKQKGLSSEKLEAISESLVARQHYLRGEVRASADNLASDDLDRSGDDADAATFAADAELALDTRARDSKELQLIEDALRRIEIGTYGRCDECERAIAIPRLEALPFTPFCIDCQEKLEEEGVPLDRREYQPHD